MLGKGPKGEGRWRSNRDRAQAWQSHFGERSAKPPPDPGLIVATLQWPTPAPSAPDPPPPLPDSPSPAWSLFWEHLAQVQTLRRCFRLAAPPLESAAAAAGRSSPSSPSSSALASATRLRLAAAEG